MQGIEQAIERLQMPDEWRDAVLRVGAPTVDHDLEGWLDNHERVYLSVLQEAKR